MSTFNHAFEIAASTDGPFVEVVGMVDTGSLLTFIPRAVLERLGIAPSEKLRFTLANGEDVLRDATEIVFRLDGRIRHSLCVFGDDKDMVLLGALALETFTLAADPANERLVRMPVVPAAATD